MKSDVMQFPLLSQNVLQSEWFFLSSAQPHLELIVWLWLFTPIKKTQKNWTFQSNREVERAKRPPSLCLLRMNASGIIQQTMFHLGDSQPPSSLSTINNPPENFFLLFDFTMLVFFSAYVYLFISFSTPTMMGLNEEGPQKSLISFSRSIFVQIWN